MWNKLRHSSWSHKNYSCFSCFVTTIDLDPGAVLASIMFLWFALASSLSFEHSRVCDVQYLLGPRNPWESSHSCFLLGNYHISSDLPHVDLLQSTLETKLGLIQFNSFIFFLKKFLLICDRAFLCRLSQSLSLWASLSYEGYSSSERKRVWKFLDDRKTKTKTKTPTFFY